MGMARLVYLGAVLERGIKLGWRKGMGLCWRRMRMRDMRWEEEDEYGADWGGRKQVQLLLRLSFLSRFSSRK